MSRISPKKKSAGVEKSQPTAVLPPERNLIFKFLLILLAGLFVYAPVFHADWLWDDDQEITQSPILPDLGRVAEDLVGSRRRGLFPAEDHRAMGAVSLHWGRSHRLAYGQHHPASCVNALLVWLLLRRLGLRQGWLGGLLFAIHPILVESVAWASELKNTLSLPFLLLSMLAYLNFDERRKYSDLAISVLFYLAAILCKTSVVMYPFVILLYGVEEFGFNPGKALEVGVSTAPYDGQCDGKSDIGQHSFFRNLADLSGGSRFTFSTAERSVVKRFR